MIIQENYLHKLLNKYTFILYFNLGAYIILYIYIYIICQLGGPPTAYGLGQYLQDLAHSFSPYGLTLSR